MNEHYVVISHPFSLFFFGKVSSIIALPRTFLEIFLPLLERNSAEAIEKISDIFSILMTQYYLDAIHFMEARWRWLVRSIPNRVVRVRALAGVTVLCS